MCLRILTLKVNWVLAEHDHFSAFGLSATPKRSYGGKPQHSSVLI
jgi:hypothetical protein